MNFYEEIAHKLYVQDTTIGPTRLHWKAYIDAMHDKAEYQGETYYSNVMAEMVVWPFHFGMALTGDFYKQVINYCREKIKSPTSEIPAASQHFRDLLSNFNDLEFCLNALRTKPVPIIDESNNFLLGGKKKSALSGWVSALRLGFLREGVTNEEIAAMIPTVIPNITITDRCLENKDTKAALRFANQISLRLRR